MARLKADPALEKEVTELRNLIRDTGKRVRRLAQAESLLKTIPAEEGLRAEGFANAMLSFRHLEDGRMRLGKLLQSAQGGESIFDQPQESVSEPKPQGGA